MSDVAKTQPRLVEVAAVRHEAAGLAQSFGAAANASFIISPVALSVYGVGWRVAGVMTGKSWPKWLSLGAFGAAIGLALLAGHPEQSLAYTAALIVFAILPGLSLLLRQPAN